MKETYVSEMQITEEYKRSRVRRMSEYLQEWYREFDERLMERDAQRLLKNLQDDKNDNTE